MGIEQERFVDVSQELLCCICAGVLEDPVESPCRHVFCSECISTWLNTRASCPNCRKKMLASELKPALPLVKNIIAKLQIRCDFVELGCKETVDLELFKTHCNSCQFAPISCGNEGCGMNFQRKDKDFHESVCPYRRVICSEGCGLNVSFSDLGNHNCVESLKCLIKDMEVQFSTKIEQLSVKVSALEEIVNSLKERPAVEQPRPQSQRDNDSELVLSFSETDDPLWSPRHENIPGLNVQVDSDSHSDDSIYYQPHNFLRTMNNARLLVDHVNQMQQDVGQGVQTQSTSQRERSRSRSPLRLVPHRNQRRHQELNIQRRGGLSHSSGMPHSSHSNNNESLGTLARRRRRRRQPRPERVSLDGTENNSLHDSSDHQELNHRRSSSGNSSNVVSVVVPNDHSGRDPDESQYRDSQSSSPSSDSASSDYSSSTSFEGLDSPQAWIRDTLSPIAVSGDSSCSLSS